MPRLKVTPRGTAIPTATAVMLPSLSDEARLVTVAIIVVFVPLVELYVKVAPELRSTMTVPAGISNGSGGPPADVMHSCEVTWKPG